MTNPAGETNDGVLCVQRGLACFSRSQSCRDKSQSPVVWIAEERGNRTFEAYRQGLPRPNFREG